MFTKGETGRCVGAGKRTAWRQLPSLLRVRTITVLLIALLAAGCAPIQSLNPFYEEKDVIYDSSLTGLWTGKGDDEVGMTLRFEKDEGTDDAYRAELTFRMANPGPREPGTATITFAAHLFQVGDSRFLDLYPQGYSAKWGTQEAEVKADENPFGIAMHTVYRVRLESSHLTLAFLDDNYVKNFVEKANVNIAAKGADFFVLTGKTEELKASLLNQAEKEDLLDHDGMEFTRPE